MGSQDREAAIMRTAPIYRRPDPVEYRRGFRDAQRDGGERAPFAAWKKDRSLFGFIRSYWSGYADWCQSNAK